MNASEAAQIIESVAKSLREDPTQFYYNVNVTQIGTRITQTGPGTGLSVNVTSGGSGTTIGYVSSVQGGNIDIEAVRQGFDKRIEEEVNRIAVTLDSIASTLKSPSPDKSLLSKLLGQLKNTVLVPALQATIASVVAAAIASL